jgi:hypothetical protein
VTGELTVYYADDFSGHSELTHVIRDQRTGRLLHVQFDREPPRRLRSGSVVRMSGRELDSTLYVRAAQTDATAAGDSGVQVLSSSTAPTGDQRTLAMIVNFTDSSVSCAQDWVDDVLFTNPSGYSVDALYRDNSHGLVSFSGSVLPPVTINALRTDACDISGWAQAADTLAAGSGVDLSAYSHKMYVMPPSQCGAAGMGTVGGPTGRTWVFSCGSKGVYSHELGHNLGMDHASTPALEYGDGTDPMSAANWMLRGLNAPHRQQLGWLPPSAYQVVSQDGLYQVAPIAADPATASLPQVVTIRKPDTNEYYYLSYRYPGGFDDYIDGSYYYRLNIHRYLPGGSLSRTFLLAGLADAETFADSVNGITITELSHDSLHAAFQVHFSAPCVQATPVVNVSPQDQAGTAGAPGTYVMSLTNGDSANCPASTFSVSDLVPSNFTASISATSVVALPGTTAQTSMVLTPSQSAAPGTYQASLQAQDPNVALHAVTANVTYTVQPPADTQPPTTPTNVSASVVMIKKSKQVQLSWAAATDNMAVAGYRIFKNGALVSTTPATSWSDATVATGYTYSYAVGAYDAAGNSSPQSSSVSVNLSSNGGGGGGQKR